MELPRSTLEGLETPSEARTGAWSRRVVLVLLLAVVAAALGGRLGDSTETRRTSGGGYDLSLTWASSSRAGLDVPWRVTVRHAGGFADDITIGVTGDYFVIYETQGFHPQPKSSTRDGRTLFLTFDKPPGDTLVIDYDAYIQPASQVGRAGTLSVIDHDGAVASIDFTTALLP